MRSYLMKLRSNYIFVYGVNKGVRKYRLYQAIKAVSVLFALIAALIAVLNGSLAGQSFFACVLLVALTVIIPDVLIHNNVKKKKESVNLGLADFMDQTAILLEAGMPLWRAIAETAYRQDKKDAFAGEILLAVKKYSGRDGYFCAPEEAIYELAERCSTVMVSSFVSTVIQNSRKGSDELVYIFKNQAASYRAERKNIAKKRAEEASALMILPTAMVFIAVIAIVTVPAVMTVIEGIFI